MVTPFHHGLKYVAEAQGLCVSCNACETVCPVGIPLADTIDAFSLDDQLIYGSPTLSGNGQYVIPVYVFDPSTGLVTDNGAAITMPSEYSSLIPALRY